MARNQTQDAQQLYDNRAAQYDDSWHPRFASQMVALAQLQPGEHVLDLACGTGAVTFPTSTAVGETGSVTCVEISTGMLEQANAKLVKHPVNNVHFIKHSITDLDAVNELQGKQFDAIICASALVLLEDAAGALRQWTSYLKPGGRLITDATHPRNQLPFITFERVGRQLDYPVPWYREPFQGPQDLQQIFEAAGLRDVRIRLFAQTIKHATDDWQDYVHDFDHPRIERTYTVEDADAHFDARIGHWAVEALAAPNVKDEARALFREEWAKLADAAGIIEEVDGVFVGVGWKA
jgi:ubiquinone/menaquinone biosynthesis C-methylase UbiE